MNDLKYVGAFLIFVLVSSFSQILLKSSANEGRTGLRIYFNFKVILAYCIFFCAMISIAMLYRFLPLSIGTLLESASFIFVPTLSYFFLKEKMTIRQIMGILLILIGIIVSVLF